MTRADHVKAGITSVAVVLIAIALANATDKVQTPQLSQPCDSPMCQQVMAGLIDCMGSQICEAKVMIGMVWDIDHGYTLSELVQDVTFDRYAMCASNGDPCCNITAENQDLANFFNAYWQRCGSCCNPNTGDCQDHVSNQDCDLLEICCNGQPGDCDASCIHNAYMREITCADRDPQCGNP